MTRIIIRLDGARHRRGAARPVLTGHYDRGVFVAEVRLESGEHRLEVRSAGPIRQTLFDVLNRQGLTLTVFRRATDGRYGWSIKDDDGLHWSPGGYDDEEEALDALSHALEKW